VKEHRGAKPFASDRPLHVMFRDVSFVYQQRSDVIRIPSLEVLQGERVAIVGPMEPARARLYDVDSGEILIAGADIRRVALDSCGRLSAICQPSRSSFTGPSPLTSESEDPTPRATTCNGCCNWLG